MSKVNRAHESKGRFGKDRGIIERLLHAIKAVALGDSNARIG